MTPGMTVALLLAVGLVLAGLVAGAFLLLRQRASAGGGLEADPMTPHLTADVHAGEEQVLIHLARTLQLPVGRDDADYGQVYIAGGAGSTLRLATRSEIGRGFDGEVRVHRTRRSSVAEYFILRLPGDEQVLETIAGLDGRIATALRSLDPEVRVRRARTAQDLLRGFSPTTR